MSGDPTERRASPRRAARFPLYVALSGELYHKMVSVAARDVSNGGLAFETKTPLPPGARATLMLGKIGGAPSTAHIVARVVHGQPSADGEGYTIGVRFEEFVDVKAEDLLAHITRGE